MELNTGITGSIEMTVTYKDTARAYCSGTLEVLATPSMIALMEQTAMESVAGLLPVGKATVGSEVNIRHLKATVVGQRVKATSELMHAEGRKLVFKVECFCGEVLIGTGTHSRYIVDAQNFPGNI
jgi:predicted thioesterase